MRRVVVTGLGVVSPLGTGQTAFFDGLRSARPGIRPIQSFDARAFPTRIAGEVPDVDPGRVSCPEPEAPALRRDRKALYGLLAGREALADAFGDRPPTTWYAPDRLAAFIATGLEIFHLDDLDLYAGGGALDGGVLLRSFAESPPRARLETPSDLAARVLVREAGIGGLVSINVSACAAGTQVLGEALWALRDGAADAALVGGYDSMVNPLGIGGFSMLGALSQQNALGAAASRPFDRDRDGFVLGEGAGMCVFEELTSARRRGARILAEVLGYGSTLDAFRVSDPDPEQRGAIAAIQGALADAGLGPEAIDYVNAHGTGTPKNDPAETRALHAVLGARAPAVPVSSTKSQIGHLIGAAGAVEMAACVFALREQLLPATINLEHPDPACDLDYVPGAPRAAVVRRVLSNSFGFGGQNATLILGRFDE